MLHYKDKNWRNCALLVIKNVRIVYAYSSIESITRFPNKSICLASVILHTYRYIKRESASSSFNDYFNELIRAKFTDKWDKY